MVRATAAIRLKTAHCSDRRINVMENVLNGIKMVKICVWEEFFWNRIQAERK